MQMTGSRIIIECLVERGVDVVFGYPGGTVLNIYDELYRNADRIRHILTAHEQGASHAADGYARSTGKPGVVIATSGPGATNLVTGIATAYMDSVPLVAITGNVPLSLLGKDSFQEVDIAGVTMPITKHNFIVKDVRELADTIRLAFEIATTGRPGPVLVDITKDVTAAWTEWVSAEGSAASRAKTAPNHRFTVKSNRSVTASELDDAAALIAAAEKPFIYAGGGVIIADAASQLREFAERLNAPCALSLMGHGAMPADHPLFTGMIGMHGTKASNMAAGAADLLIAVGARFSDRVVSKISVFAKKAKILHIDIDPAEINKNVKSYTSLVGDVKEILTDLNARIAPKTMSAWNGDIAAWKRERPSSHETKKALHPRFILETIHEKVGDEAFITTEVGQHQMWTAQFYPFSKPRTFITSGGLGTMGFGTGAAMGVQIAHPEAQVVHIAGDGSFRMNCAELATIVNYNLPILIIVFNNGTLGMVRQWQTMFYDKRYCQTTLDRPPDFVKLADAYGLPSYRAREPEEFRACLDAALSHRGPALIECVLDIDEKVLPMVPAGKPIDELILEPGEN
ncbi:MAG TPA: biosynthetic-type acetolactate synthase large subunit [Rectinemataceae bacterium]|nr:biosynthetic-type acetolactate synthase large subunit [Rectinemataceae bacterium]